MANIDQSFLPHIGRLNEVSPKPQNINPPAWGQYLTNTLRNEWLGSKFNRREFEPAQSDGGAMQMKPRGTCAILHRLLQKAQAVFTPRPRGMCRARFGRRPPTSLKSAEGEPPLAKFDQFRPELVKLGRNWLTLAKSVGQTWSKSSAGGCKSLETSCMCNCSVYLESMVGAFAAAECLSMLGVVCRRVRRPPRE